MIKRAISYNRIIMICVLAFTLSLMTAGCGMGKDRTTEDKDGTYYIYCLDRDENTLPYYEYGTETTDTNRLIDELINEMSTVKEDVGYREAIRDFDIVSVSLEDKQLILTVDEKYSMLSPTTEVLTRAAIVRTLGQIEGIDFISMRYMGEELKDALGQPIGPMNVAAFIDNPGDEINSYENKELKLFFANTDGTGLVEVTRDVEYNTSISVEKLIVEQLIKGTEAEQLRSTINPQTEIINITVKDGTCYVNLNNAFLTVPEGISPEVMLYSVVDSLMQVPGIQKVQFLIDGESNVNLTDNISLSNLYDRNLDIIK